MRPRDLYISIILAIAIGDSLIIFSAQEDKLFFANLVLNINSSIAASLAIFVTIKEKDKSNLKANIFLVVGLVLWFVANIVWAYYEVILHLMAPVPSLADVLLLSAYSILIVRLYIEYKSLKNKPSKKFAGAMAGVISVFLAYIFSLTLDLSVVSTIRGRLMFAVTVIYPAFNSVLSFMAIIILYGLRKEKDIEKEIEKKLHGSSSLTYPILAYDTLWVTALSLEKISDNMTSDINTDIDIESLKKIINATAADYNGISGNIVLNAAGDRINANYDIWSVAQSQDDHENYVWKQNIEGNYSQSNN